MVGTFVMVIPTETTKKGTRIAIFLVGCGSTDEQAVPAFGHGQNIRRMGFWATRENNEATTCSAITNPEVRSGPGRVRRGTDSFTDGRPAVKFVAEPPGG